MTDQAVVRAEGLDVSEADDGFLVMTADGADVHHLNGAASLIFELCTGTLGVDQITAVVGSFIPDGSVGRAEVVGCIEQLQALGLVQPTS